MFGFFWFQDSNSNDIELKKNFCFFFSNIMPEMDNKNIHKQINDENNKANIRSDSNDSIKLLNHLDDLMTMCEEKLKSLTIELIHINGNNSFIFFLFF